MKPKEFFALTPVRLMIGVGIVVAIVLLILRFAL